MMYIIFVITSFVRRALLASVIIVPTTIAVSCSAQPPQAITASDYDIAALALKNGGYADIHQLPDGQAAAWLDSCRVVADFTPMPSQPMLVTGLLIDSDNNSHPLGEGYLPTADVAKTLPVFTTSKCVTVPR